MFRTLLTAAAAAFIASACLAATAEAPSEPPAAATARPEAKTPETAPAKTGTTPPPYNAADERARFLKAAGADKEIDAGEFAAAKGKARDKGKDESFVRETDTWADMLKHDKDKNGTIGWPEADAYRQSLRTTPGAEATPPQGAPRGTWAINDPKTVTQYDSDGDGTLDAAERLAAWRARAEETRRDLIKEYDKNGDGTLDTKERQAVRESLRARLRRAAERRHDEDGDGALGDAETAAMVKDEAEREERRKAFIARYDKDGDGRLSPGERRPARADWRRRRAERPYDKDGNGTLSDEERAAMDKERARGTE